MSLLQQPIARLDGTAATLGEITGGRPALVVNVASQVRPHPAVRRPGGAARAVRRPRLHRRRRALQPVRRPGAGHRRGDRGVLLRDLRRDVPDDREGRGQRRRPAPRVRRAGAGRRPGAAATGDVQWNFEKFLLDGSGAVVARFDPTVVPDDPRGDRRRSSPLLHVTRTTGRSPAINVRTGLRKYSRLWPVTTQTPPQPTSRRPEPRPTSSTSRSSWSPAWSCSARSCRSSTSPSSASRSRPSSRCSTPRPAADRLDDDRLHAGARLGDPADRLGRRPVRHQAALHARGRRCSPPARCCARPPSSIEMLTAFRVLQGLGGGMLMPLGMTIMTRAAGPERIGRVMAVLGVPMLLGPIFGPILGGWLIDIASWHWIFLINLPIGAVALAYAAIVLPSDSPDPVGELRLRRHAAALAGPGAVPVRRLLDPRGRHRLGHQGARHRRDRARARRRSSCCARCSARPSTR